ncbi:MAG: FAD:protein FMN transferase [FCB group bacterium]|jgi:thiamine biosynthesis lipoprotein|nr:FAD:protein FMN transferase [FCB group bacterium]
MIRVVLVALVLPGYCLGCSGGTIEETLFAGEAQGTTYSIKVAAGGLSKEQKHELEAAIRRRFDEIDRAMSLYREDSELAAFNRQQTTEPIRVCREFIEVFQAARAVSEASDGALDVTVAPLVSAWGFGPAKRKDPLPPSDVEITELLQRVGFRGIEIDASAGTIRKTRSDLECDVNGIAQGYTVDKLAEDLQLLGYSNYLVEVGGEVRARGRNARGTCWQVAIEKPIAEGGEYQKVLSLDSLSLTTAGDYRNYIEQNGVRLSHSIDPRTGRPISHSLASVSVIHADCAMADGYDTALMVLGPEKGYELAVKKGLAALFIIHGAEGYEVKATPAFDSIAGRHLP